MEQRLPRPVLQWREDSHLLSSAVVWQRGSLLTEGAEDNGGLGKVGKTGAGQEVPGGPLHLGQQEMQNSFSTNRNQCGAWSFYCGWCLRSWF